MSWLFSQALVAEYLGDICSDGEPSAQSNGSHTQLAYLPPDKTTDLSRLSRFGMTFKPLTADRGEELLTSYLAAFPARTSASQAVAQDLTESAQGCGDIWRGWLAKYDPATSSWKTAQCSFIEDLNESSVTFPRSGMTRDGLLWELPMLERHINETGSGSWPTPQASDNRPRATANSTARRIKLGKQVSLEAAVKFWPTPTAHNAKEGGFPSEHNRNTPTLSAQAGGSLNPTWVEWLMGWPLGWTDLKPLETDKSHCAQQQHGTT
jgi:hypothetical protein